MNEKLEELKRKKMAAEKKLGSVKDWTLSTAVNMVKGIEGRGCLILGIVLQNTHYIIC